MKDNIVKLGIFIPPDVLFDKELSANEKILLGMIREFFISSEDKKCTVTNRELANLLNVSQQTISNMIHKFCKLRYIGIEYKPMENFTKQTQRYLYVIHEKEV